MGETQTPGSVTPAAEARDPEVSRFLTDSLDRVVRHLNPERLIVFGSRVEGIADEWSDIDVVVVSREFENMRLLPRMALFRRIARPHIRVDAICCTPEELEYLLSQPSVVREAVRTGLRII